MIVLSEGSLRFTFSDDNWSAVKFDNSDWHKREMKSALKAMDILAKNHDKHWWIEIKDCASYETDNLPRLSPIEPDEVKQTKDWVNGKNWDKIVKTNRKKLFIVDEIVEKLRGTLFSLTIANRKQYADMVDYSRCVNAEIEITVILVLTWNIVDFKRFAKLLNQKLQTALQAYGIKGFVINESESIRDFNCTVSRVN